MKLPFLFMFPFNAEEVLEIPNEYGIDQLELMCKFLLIIEADNIKENWKLFIRYLCKELKRSLTDTEIKNLIEGVLKYVRSVPATKEREEAMQYIFGLKFLIIKPVT